MNVPRVAGVICVDLGVTDLARSQDFYTRIWLLNPVLETASTVYLRGSGTFHHILALHRRPVAEALRVTLLAPDVATVDALHARILRTQPTAIENPATSSEPGGGYGFCFKDPEGRTLRIIADSHRHADDLANRDQPNRDQPRHVTHVVMNTPDRAAMASYYSEHLGFRVVDETSFMTFLSAGSDHHCIAMAHHPTPGLNHIAFETANFDAVMRGIGRLRESGVEIEWGVGRHGPGNNIFAYFLGPDGEVIEYTADVMQIDETYRVGGPSDWALPPGRTDQWALTPGPKESYQAAQGKIRFAAAIFRPA